MVNWKSKYLKYKLKYEKLIAGSLSSNNLQTYGYATEFLNDIFEQNLINLMTSDRSTSCNFLNTIVNDASQVTDTQTFNLRHNISEHVNNLIVRFFSPEINYLKEKQQFEIISYETGSVRQNNRDSHVFTILKTVKNETATWSLLQNHVNYNCKINDSKDILELNLNDINNFLNFYLDNTNIDLLKQILFRLLDFMSFNNLITTEVPDILAFNKLKKEYKENLNKGVPHYLKPTNLITSISSYEYSIYRVYKNYSIDKEYKKFMRKKVERLTNSTSWG